LTKEELKEWRLNRGLTQSAAAEKIGGCGYHRWQRWELGTTPVPCWLPIMLELFDIVDGMVGVDK